MADRFPSLEEFDSGAQTDIKDSLDLSGDDFLAREKAVLGADANQFAASVDVSLLVESTRDLPGDSDAAQSTFESQFPDLASPSAVASGIPGSDSIIGPSVHYQSGYQTHVEDQDESEMIRQWKDRRDEQIAKRADMLEAQREETIKEAQKNIDDFYENYNAKKEKGISQTRNEAEQFLATQEETVSGGTSWDRIAQLVDISGKGTKGGAGGSGKERFREMLASLRKDENAPVI
ncbi:hypothetical protein CDD83_5437 [Cordyceps sp. RAO-2017]|nr:hypothetical protein CDD83_5437 [Cordyceps sp. RAO-2017]